MLVTGFPAGAWGTNCYLVAPGPRDQCVIVDPGHESAAGIADLVREHHLQPVAVLLTHGHLDHTFSVIPVCGSYDVAAYIHPADRHQLADPASGLGLTPGQQLFPGITFGEPADVVELTGHDRLRLAGLDVAVDHAPGHTRGSVTFRVDDVLLSGDLLMQGTIGRTDLPGGSYDEMLDSLARVVLPLPDQTAVLSGHGDATTVGVERVTNPYLAEAAARAAGRTAGDVTAPGRGL